VIEVSNLASLFVQVAIQLEAKCAPARASYKNGPLGFRRRLAPRSLFDAHRYFSLSQTVGLFKIFADL
jgi:hypothetical protein